LKVKLKWFKGVPEGGVPEGGVVFDRFPRVWDRRFGQGLLWWFAKGAKERLNEGCSGGSQGSGVRNLAKERLRGYSGGLRGYSALQKSDFNSSGRRGPGGFIAIGIVKRLN
jgi:hypothetical protein